MKTEKKFVPDAIYLTRGMFKDEMQVKITKAYAEFRIKISGVSNIWRLDKKDFMKLLGSKR